MQTGELYVREDATFWTFTCCLERAGGGEWRNEARHEVTVRARGCFAEGSRMGGAGFNGGVLARGGGGRAAGRGRRGAQ